MTNTDCVSSRHATARAHQNITDRSARKRNPAAFAAFVCLCLIAFLPLPAGAYITVLLYHRFDENRYPSTTTGSAQFEQQMRYLKTNGYTVLSMDALADCVKGRRPIPEKGVVITIDDGFISEYERAVPILRRYRYPFCIFVFSHGIGATNYLSWSQLKELESWGGEVGCHSHTHPRLINSREQEMEQEIRGSKEFMERNLGRKVKYFAYPFGQYDGKVRASARRAGFRLMLTSDPGSVGPLAEYDRIPRQAIVGSGMSARDFAAKLQNPPLRVTRRFPESGTLPCDIVARISITLESPDLYEPDQVNVFLSEKKRLDAHFDPVTGVVSCSGPFYLTRKTNRIIVTARRKSDGLFAMDSCLIVLPGKPVPGLRMRYTLKGGRDDSSGRGLAMLHLSHLERPIVDLWMTHPVMTFRVDSSARLW